MTIRLIEGFDFLNPAPGVQFGDLVTYNRWQAIGNNALSSATLVTGRYAGPGSALRISAGGGVNAFVQKLNALGPNGIGAAPGYFVIGFAFLIETGTANNFMFLTLDDGTGPPTGGTQLSLQLSSQNNWQLLRGFGGALIATGTSIVQIGRWYYLELKVGLSNTVGFAQMRQDGVEVFNVTGADTIGVTNTVGRLDGFAIGAINTGSRNLQFDDLYVLDETGPVNNDFLGERRVFTLYPTAPGAVTGFSPGGTTPAPTNWQSVDDPTPNVDVDYVTSSALNATDTYVFGGLGTNTIVNAVQFNLAARKTDAGPRSIASVQRSAGGTVVAGPNLVVGAGGYEMRSNIAETSLVTAAAWTPAEINASQFGVRVTV